MNREEHVGRLLTEKGLTLAVAESCTGGLVCHRLTNVSGSSAYLERGLVVYSNRAKCDLLGVPEDVLREKGAVSAATAELMALGARRGAGVDLGLSITGIAGPTGGSELKPVGTVFIALASPRGLLCEHHRFAGERSEVKTAAAERALTLVEEFLAGEGPTAAEARRS